MDLLTRLRKRKASKNSRQLIGRKVGLTEADRIGLAQPHPMESRVETPFGTMFSNECFMFRDRQLGDMVFNVRRIKDAILSGELRHWALFEVPMTEGFHAHLMKDGVETSEERIYEMDPSWAEIPALGVDWNDGSHNMTIIDGNHRLIRRFRDGQPTARIILAPMQFLRRYVLLDRLGELSAATRLEFSRMPPAR